MAKKRKSSRKTSARKTTRRRKAARRELIQTGRDARFVRRGQKGRFKESADVGRHCARTGVRKRSARCAPVTATKATDKNPRPTR